MPRAGIHVWRVRMAQVGHEVTALHVMAYRRAAVVDFTERVRRTATRAESRFLVYHWGGHC
jgi:hypothetical protein